MIDFNELWSYLEGILLNLESNEYEILFVGKLTEQIKKDIMKLDKKDDKIIKYYKIVNLVNNTLFHFESVLSNEHIENIMKENNYFDGFYEINKIINGVE